MTATPGYVVVSTTQSKYVDGDVVQVTASFFNVSGEPVAPTTATVEYSPAGSTVVTGPFSMSLVSTGVYTYDIDTTGFGAVQVVVECFGTGTCQTEGQAQFALDVLPF